MIFDEQNLPSWSRRKFLGAVAAASTSCCSIASAIAAEKKRPSEFITLFDGTSLEGWHTNPKRIGHGTGGQWQVRDGVLTGEQDPPGSGNGGLLLSDRKFADFELEIEMHPDWGPDTGVFFRCTEEGAGFQMYVDYHDNGNVGHIRGEMPGSFAIMPYKITGKMNAQKQLTGFETRIDPRAIKWPKGVYEYSCTAQQWLKAWRVGEWNKARIRCVGKFPRITTWINDLRVCDFDGESSPLPAYDKERVFGILGRSGSIGLQVHGGKNWPNGAKCRWKNIRIREL